MSKMVGKLLEDVAWLQNLSGFLTLFFFMIFIVIIVRVLSWKKEQVEEFKNMPLTDEEPDEC
ncbi:MAG: CcoQ/FixQ family Cbb3-type cytochrome c oxidase assembly chaperone [Bacteroidetes bacterium]|nr:CcoQ/FixQ family Cbb3-type cytochrome c oxidase assembly chaperone [Bacteroidota bacterium]